MANQPSGELGYFEEIETQKGEANVYNMAGPFSKVDGSAEISSCTAAAAQKVSSNGI